ncbi:MAG: Regulatory protein RecX [Pelotomaculum sp. PtaB.Bin013]|nr:MAG: Regulatory protein RecX [Pelotomaculum sp. PtaB.Bin013]
MKSEFEKARSLALRMLVFRRRSKHELEQCLKRKGFSPEVSRPVLDVLGEYGYIDDMEFARCWVNQRLGKRGLRGLKQELRGKGICTSIIDDILGKLGFDKEYDAAMKLVEKEMLRSSGAYNLPRLVSLLNRRGYTCEVINKIHHKVKDGERY